MPITWDSQEPQTATTSPSNLGQTLGNMLPMPERPPPQDPSTFGQAPVDYLSAVSSWTSPIPSAPSEGTLAAGRTLARYGLPAVGGFIGASGGPLTAGLASAGGELAGQWAAGDPINLPAVGLSGALGTAGNLAGRAISGLGRAARSVLSSGGDDAIQAAVASGEQVPMSNIRSAINDLLEAGARGGVGVGREPTTGFEKLRQFATKFEATTRTEMPMQEVAAMRDELGQLMVELRQGSPAFHKAQALYGALMSDLRQSIATGAAPSAAGYLSAMTDKHIAHALVPESMLERILLYGLGGAAAYGHPGALWPAAGLLGVRAFRATPPSVLDQIGAGAATLANPYRRRE